MPKRPPWFVVACIALLVWAVAGVGSFAAHVAVGERLAAEQGVADLAFYRALPAWFAWDYGLATLTALGGAIALLVRSRRAVLLYVVSLVAVLVQFGHVFIGTDLLARKGMAATVPFPAFIVLMACVQIVLARLAVARGWIDGGRAAAR